VPCRAIGQQVQRTSSGSTPHDRITIQQICPSLSLPLHRPRQSALKYPAVDANRSPTHSVQRHLRLTHEPLPLRPTRWIGSIPITHRIRGNQIPIVNAAPPTSLSRGFLPGRFAYAGPPRARRHHHGAGIRKPSPERPLRCSRFPHKTISARFSRRVMQRLCLHRYNTYRPYGAHGGKTPASTLPPSKQNKPSNPKCRDLGSP
jgi:hypothetical protein